MIFGPQLQKLEDSKDILPAATGFSYISQYVLEFPCCKNMTLSILKLFCVEIAYPPGPSYGSVGLALNLLLVLHM